MTDRVFNPHYRWGQKGAWVIISISVQGTTTDPGYFKHILTPEGELHLEGFSPKQGKFSFDLELFERVRVEDSKATMNDREIQLRIRKLEGRTKWTKLQKPHLPVRRPFEHIDPDYIDSDVESSDDDDDDDDDADYNIEELDPNGEMKKKKKLPPEIAKKIKAEEGFFERGLSKANRLFKKFLFVPDLVDFMILGAIFVSVWLCPYTKVEESFNMQAIHDFIYHKWNLSSYDHIEFPGAVPRTFLGAAITAVLASPWVLFFSTVIGAPKIMTLHIVRYTLGAMFCLCICKLRHEVARKFGLQVGIAFGLVTISEYHMIFYASRPLPNTFALMMCLVAFTFWLQERYDRTFWVLAVCASVFRAEVALLLGCIFIFALVRGRVKLVSGVMNIAVAAIIGAVISTVFDSVLWGFPVWPELHGFIFNVVKGKSIEWGASPFYFYFLSGLPRALLGNILLLPGGAIWCLGSLRSLGLRKFLEENFFDRKIRPFVLPMFLFIFLYSFLAHKELRFIIYTIPIFNIAVAITLNYLFTIKEKKYGKWLFQFGVTLTIASFMMSFGFLRVSMSNYPGAEALNRMHVMELPAILDGRLGDPHVHIGVAAAQTGITRYMETYRWKYSKREDVHDMSVYSHLLLGGGDKVPQGFEVIDKIRGHDGFDLARGAAVQSDKIQICRRIGAIRYRSDDNKKKKDGDDEEEEEEEEDQNIQNP